MLQLFTDQPILNGTAKKQPNASVDSESLNGSEAGVALREVASSKRSGGFSGPDFQAVVSGHASQGANDDSGLADQDSAHKADSTQSEGFANDGAASKSEAPLGTDHVAEPTQDADIPHLTGEQLAVAAPHAFANAQEPPEMRRKARTDAPTEAQAQGQTELSDMRQPVSPNSGQQLAKAKDNRTFFTGQLPVAGDTVSPTGRDYVLSVQRPESAEAVFTKTTAPMRPEKQGSKDYDTAGLPGFTPEEGTAKSVESEDLVNSTGTTSLKQPLLEDVVLPFVETPSQPGEPRQTGTVRGPDDQQGTQLAEHFSRTKPISLGDAPDRGAQVDHGPTKVGTTPDQIVNLPPMFAPRVSLSDMNVNPASIGVTLAPSASDPGPEAGPLFQNTRGRTRQMLVPTETAAASFATNAAEQLTQHGAAEQETKSNKTVEKSMGVAWEVEERPKFLSDRLKPDAPEPQRFDHRAEPIGAKTGPPLSDRIPALAGFNAGQAGDADLVRSSWQTDTQVVGPLSQPGEALILRGPQDTLMQSPELPRHIARQIVVAIAAGSDRIVELRLNPVELGKVRISLAPSETGIMVSFLADRQETIDLMRRHADQLAQDFQDIGYESTEFHFGQSMAEQSKDDHEAETDNVSAPFISNQIENHDGAARTGQKIGVDLDYLDIRL